MLLTGTHSRARWEGAGTASRALMAAASARPRGAAPGAHGAVQGSGWCIGCNISARVGASAATCTAPALHRAHHKGTLCCIGCIICRGMMHPMQHLSTNEPGKTTNQPGNRPRKPWKTTNEPNPSRTNLAAYKCLPRKAFWPFHQPCGRFDPEPRPDCRANPCRACVPDRFRI